jgi:uncharacterized protein
MRVVIDTNLFISAAINAHSRQRLDAVLLNTSLTILLDTTLLAEIYEVIHRPKFRRYITEDQADTFLALLTDRCTFVQTTSTIKASPDPKDDFLLALCLDNQADYLLTGNKLDLLALKTFGNTRIVTLTEFLTLFPG